MAKTTTKCGGKGRLSIFRIDVMDKDGNIIDAWFEVFDGDVKLNGNFASYDEAIKFIEATLDAENTPEQPSSGFSPGM